MNDLASAIARRPKSAPGARWAALLLVLAAIVLPDCCLNGSHGFGSGMETFGPFCRARV